MQRQIIVPIGLHLFLDIGLFKRRSCLSSQNGQWLHSGSASTALSAILLLFLLRSQVPSLSGDP